MSNRNNKKAYKNAAKRYPDFETDSKQPSHNSNIQPTTSIDKDHQHIERESRTQNEKIISNQPIEQSQPLLMLSSKIESNTKLEAPQQPLSSTVTYNSPDDDLVLDGLDNEDEDLVESEVFEREQDEIKKSQAINTQVAQNSSQSLILSASDRLSCSGSAIFTKPETTSTIPASSQNQHQFNVPVQPPIIRQRFSNRLPIPGYKSLPNNGIQPHEINQSLQSYRERVLMTRLHEGNKERQKQREEMLKYKKEIDDYKKKVDALNESLQTEQSKVRILISEHTFVQNNPHNQVLVDDTIQSQHSNTLGLCIHNNTMTVEAIRERKRQIEAGDFLAEKDFKASNSGVAKRSKLANASNLKSIAENCILEQPSLLIDGSTSSIVDETLFEDLHKGTEAFVAPTRTFIQHNKPKQLEVETQTTEISIDPFEFGQMKDTLVPPRIDSEFYRARASLVESELFYERQAQMENPEYAFIDKPIQRHKEKNARTLSKNFYDLLYRDRNLKNIKKYEKVAMANQCAKLRVFRPTVFEPDSKKLSEALDTMDNFSPHGSECGDDSFEAIVVQRAMEPSENLQRISRIQAHAQLFTGNDEAQEKKWREEIEKAKQADMACTLKNKIKYVAAQKAERMIMLLQHKKLVELARQTQEKSINFHKGKCVEKKIPSMMTLARYTSINRLN